MLPIPETDMSAINSLDMMITGDKFQMIHVFLCGSHVMLGIIIHFQNRRSRFTYESHEKQMQESFEQFTMPCLDLKTWLFHQCWTRRMMLHVMRQLHDMPWWDNLRAFTTFRG